MCLNPFRFQHLNIEVIPLKMSWKASYFGICWKVATPAALLLSFLLFKRLAFAKISNALDSWRGLRLQLGFY